MTKSILAFLFLIAPIALAPVAPAQTPPAAVQASTGTSATQPIDSIVAVVDDDIILRSELAQAMRNVKAQYAGHESQLPPEDALRKQVLERLVLARLQLSRAADNGIKTSDAEVDQGIAALAQQNHVTMAQLQAKLAAEGMSYDAFRKSIRDEITIQKLQQKVMENQLAVSDTEIDNELATQRAGGPQLHLANILVGLPPDATSEQVAKAQKKIGDIRDLVVNGKMDFNTAAIRYSDSQNALEGGDLGWRSADEVPPAFANIIQTLKPGEVTAPIRGSSGYQLLKLVEVRQAGHVAPKQVTEYHALDMMVRVGPGVTAEQAKAKIDAFRAQVLAGGDFGALAKKDSDDTETRDKGGDMGWFPAEGWGTAVSLQVQKLKDGEVSEPFQSDVGWHVLKLLGTRSTDVGEQALREQAKQAILRRKASDQYDTFLRQIRSDAYVDIRLHDAG
ncbi:MAG: peptidylprolyl isomerase [Proteobacteria bacterium]|nr:peptidylprolyl isomerase [Pseudomonadota bacterium]